MYIVGGICCGNFQSVPFWLNSEHLGKWLCEIKVSTSYPKTSAFSQKIENYTLMHLLNVILDWANLGLRQKDNLISWQRILTSKYVEMNMQRNERNETKELSRLWVKAGDMLFFFLTSE